MLLRVPDYYEAFHCMAGACPHTCCAKWEVVVDPETAETYLRMPGDFGERLRAALTRDEDGDWCFPLEGENCPFLDQEGLCEIHRRLGAAATSVTCREHPRFLEEYGPFCELTLSASCPAANQLLLGTTAPLTIRTVETADAEEEGDPWLADLVPLRDQMLDLLRERADPLSRRLARFLGLAEAAQAALDREQPEVLKSLEIEELPPLPAADLMLLVKLEPLEEDWPVLVRKAAQQAVAPQSPELLERIGVYFAFRYLLKAVNDGDLLSRARFCVYGVLAVERLAGACGGLGEALRRFSCEVEHDADNLETLMVWLADQ